MNDLTRYLARRALALVLALFATSVVVFGALHLTGDPVAQLAGGRPLTESQTDALRQEYNLDEPIVKQYTLWLGDLLHGDLGESIAFRQSVSSLIGPRIATTAWLVSMSLLLVAVFGLGLGVLAARKPGFADDSVLVSATIAIAIPSFVAAVVLIALFSAALGWFPTFGDGAGSISDRLYHLTLPSIALALASIGYVARTSRTSLRMEMRRDYVTTALSRGIPERLAFRRHVVRNAMIPVTTAIGLSLATMLVLTAVVEPAFGLNGVGALLVDSVLGNDFPAVQAVSLLFVVAFVVINTVVDVLYVLLDPRISFSSADR